MKTICLGRTNLTANFNGFGALPVQRVGMEEAAAILRQAFEGGVNFFDTARMSLMLRRSPTAGLLGEYWQAEMARIDECLNCGQCMSRCPYGLNTPALLKKNWEDYKTFPRS